MFKMISSAKNLVGTALSVITENVKEVKVFGKKLVERYGKYLDKENEKTRQDMKNRKMQEMYDNLLPQYTLVAEMLFEAINNTVELTYLLPVQQLSQILCQFWLGQSPNHVWYFEYRGRYRKGFGMTAESVQRILQSELTQLCGIYGHPSLTLRVAFDALGAVKFRVACTADLRAARKIAI